MRCQKNTRGWYTAYTRIYPQYTPDHNSSKQISLCALNIKLLSQKGVLPFRLLLIPIKVWVRVKVEVRLTLGLEQGIWRNGRNLQKT